MSNHTIHNTSKRVNLYFTIFVFLFSPILSVIFSVGRWREVWAKNIVWLFCSFYAYKFIIGNEGSDINRYKARFETNTFSKLELFEFLKIKISSGAVDFFEPLFSFIVASFTDNFNYYLLIIGSIFGFFYSRNIWSILKNCKNNFSFLSWLSLLVFSLIYSIWDINVLRFSLAAHIFYFGFSRLFFDKNKLGWIYLIIAPLIHFSFYIPIIIWILYLVFGNKHKIYFILFIISIVSSDIVFKNLGSNLNIVPSAFEEKASDYTGNEFIEKKKKITLEKNFRGKYYQDSLKYAVFILLIYFYIKFKNGDINSLGVYYEWFSFILLYFAIINLFQGIPTMNRFLFLGYLFAFALFAKLFTRKFIFYKNMELKIIIIPLIVFYLLMKLRVGIEFTNILVIFGGPFLSPFFEDEILLIELL